MLGQGKVPARLELSTLGHKNVCRLDVAVNDAFRVGGIESIGNLDSQV
jgi:hypothetical protein